VGTRRLDWEGRDVTRDFDGSFLSDGVEGVGFGSLEDIWVEM